MGLEHMTVTQVLDNKAILEGQGSACLALFKILVFVQSVQKVERRFFPGGLGCFGDLNVNWCSCLVLLSKLSLSFVVLLLLLELVGNFFGCGSWWGDFDLHLGVTLHLNLFNTHLGSVFEVHVEFSVAYRDLSH